MFELANGGVIVLYAITSVIPMPVSAFDVAKYRVGLVGGEAYLPEEEGKRLIEALRNLHVSTFGSATWTSAPQQPIG